MAAQGLVIRTDVATATELRRLAKKEPRRRTAQRMLAIANALEGMSRAEAARAAGIERQALRDAVVRFNAEGLAGLIDAVRAAAEAHADKQIALWFMDEARVGQKGR